MPPGNHWHTATMISSMRLNDTAACMTIEGATNTEVFQVYFREILLPVIWPGDIVILDNLGVHKNNQIRELIRQAGAEARFSPAYSS